MATGSLLRLKKEPPLKTVLGLGLCGTAVGRSHRNARELV